MFLDLPFILNTFQNPFQLNSLCRQSERPMQSHEAGRVWWKTIMSHHHSYKQNKKCYTTFPLLLTLHKDKYSKQVANIYSVVLFVLN